MGAQGVIWLSAEKAADIFVGPEEIVELVGTEEEEEGVGRLGIESRTSCGGVLKNEYEEEKVAFEVKEPYGAEVERGREGC